MGLFDKLTSWARTKFESERAVLDREAAERHDAFLAQRDPGRSDPPQIGLVGATEIARARAVAHTPWQGIDAGAGDAGQVRHTILHDRGGFYVQLEDELLGPRNYAAGPFPSLDLAHEEADRSVRAMTAAVAPGLGREAQVPHDLPREVIHRETVEETLWRAVEAEGEVAVNIRHVISRDEAGYWVQREDDEEWHPESPVGPFAELRDARHEANVDFEGLQASWVSHQAEHRTPDPESQWETGRAPYAYDAGIETVRSSDWQVTSPGHEVREHIGRSDEGWHYAVEVSRDGGDAYENGLPWSPAMKREEAEAALSERSWAPCVGHDDDGHDL